MPNRVLLALTLAAAAGLQAAAQRATFPARVELVTVDAVVFDRQGRPVEGLTAQDFTIREDGTPQTVAAFEAVSLENVAPAPERDVRISTNQERPEAAGRWFFVVFDDVNITALAAPRARGLVEQFIERALRPGDRVMVLPVSGGSNWVGELPADREDLVAFVERLQGQRRIETGPGRILDSEAIGIALGRDKQALAQVARRYFENDLIVEAGATPQENRESFGVSPGIPMIEAKARTVYSEARTRMQLSLRTLERLTAALADARGRKTVLFFSEGFIADSSLPDFRTLVQTARNANVAVHFVDVRPPQGTLAQAGLGASAETGPPGDDRDVTIAAALASREADGTRSIAADTGGTTIAGPEAIAALTRVSNEGRAYYLLGYTPTSTRRDGRFRKIEVTVDRPNVTVRARGGYFAPSSDGEPPRSDPDMLPPEVRTALDSPFGAPGIPMRLTSYVFGTRTAGTLQTLLVAEANPGPLGLQPANGRYSATFDSYVLVHDRDRGELERDERVVTLNVPVDAFQAIARTGIPLQREFALEPGRYQATLLLRDRASGTLGSVRHEFEVPAADTFRISTPVVTDAVQPPAAGQPPRPVPLARRTFAAGSRIAVAFDVYGTADGGGTPQVSVAYSIRRADGTAVSDAPPQRVTSAARGQIPVMIGVTLPSAPGEYRLQLSVRDETAVRVVEHVEPIVVTAP